MNSILAFVPLITLIALALVTRNMAASMVTAVFFAMLFLHGGHILSGTIDSFYGTLSDSSFQFCLILIVLFGGIIELFQRSGALQGFGDLISAYAKGRRKIMLLAWLMSAVMFVDEYLSSITVTFSMRDITDRNGIPREHLAFQSHTMACCLCVAVPFTSWIGFSLSLIEEYGMGFAEYVRAIPFMFFPLMMMLLTLLVALGIMPKIGNLKKAYRRVDEGGPAFLDEGAETLVKVGSAENVESSSAINALLPIIALVAGVLIFDNDLTHGLILALLCQFALYVPQKIMTVSEFFETFFSGVKGMVTITIVVFLGFTLSKANEALGFFDIVIGGVGTRMPPALIPLIAFLLVAFCVFAVGGCWIVMLITMPVFVPLAITSGASASLTVAAVMSGICMGYCLCFYADTVFMCSAGTKVSNITIIKTLFPYAAIAGVLSAIGFAVCGFLM